MSLRQETLGDEGEERRATPSPSLCLPGNDANGSSALVGYMLLLWKRHFKADPERAERLESPSGVSKCLLMKEVSLVNYSVSCERLRASCPWEGRAASLIASGVGRKALLSSYFQA